MSHFFFFFTSGHDIECNTSRYGWFLLLVKLDFNPAHSAEFCEKGASYNEPK